MKKKGFTLIELLVVIAIIAMLLAILMPALNKVKKIAQRVICGTNLKGLGTAQTVYANDYDGEYTVQGQGGLHTWGNSTANWEIPGKVWSTPGTLSVGASLFLLVREADVSPKSFICPGGDQTEWNQQTAADGAANPPDITQVWDFGSPGFKSQGPQNCVSYSYHNPYNFSIAANATKGTYSARDDRSASFAMLGDQNPYFSTKLTNLQTGSTQDTFKGLASGIDYLPTAERFKVQQGNAQPHDRDGQNVTYADGHNSYETRPDVSIKNDNIYTPSLPALGEPGRRIGRFPSATSVLIPATNEDSILINDTAAADFK